MTERIRITVGLFRCIDRASRQPGYATAHPVVQKAMIDVEIEKEAQSVYDALQRVRAEPGR